MAAPVKVSIPNEEGAEIASMGTQADQPVPEPPSVVHSTLPTLPVSPPPYLYGGASVSLTLRSGLTVFLGPNGAGKTQVLRGLYGCLKEWLVQVAAAAGTRSRIPRFLAAGRTAPFEHFRAATTNPHGPDTNPAAVGSAGYRNHRHQFESAVGDMMALHDRPDLKLKVEARLHALFGRRLRLEWGQSGLVVTFVSERGDYTANTEASGILQLVALLTALYDDQVGALLIDEPEISLHPQLQAFLLEEIRKVAGNPAFDPAKKLVVLATHAASMLPLRRAEDLPNFVFFTDAATPPLQLQPDESLLRRRKLATLVARLGESHRAALFTQSVLLVEGPSDEVVVSGLAARLDRSLHGAGAQIVAVTGAREMPEAARLFRLMGKRVTVLADLDAFVDDNALANTFAQEGATLDAVRAMGHEGLAPLEATVRNDLCRATDDRWPELEPLASGHRYLGERGKPGNPVQRRRRAALATLLTQDHAALAALPHGSDWVALRRRTDALLGVLAAGGCCFIRAGTIEDCFLRAPAPDAAGKPEAAADEVASFEGAEADELRRAYADVLRAMACATPVSPVDEDKVLRTQLGGLLGAVFQAARPGMSAAQLDAIARAEKPSAAAIFGLQDASWPSTRLAIRASITSPIFERSGFPAVFTANFTDEIGRLLGALDAGASPPGAGRDEMSGGGERRPGDV